MTDPVLEKLSRLEEIAEDDEIYQLWYRCYQDSAERFAAYADSQPEEIRDLLWAYAEGGRLMWQRMVCLSCLHMDFPEENAGFVPKILNFSPKNS